MPQFEPFAGVLPPVLTPFDEDLAPDRAAFAAHCRWLLDQGVDGLAAFGTTSEANSLSGDERMALLDALVEDGIDPAKLMPGTGCCALPDTLRLTRHALDAGCGGVLMLPPFYYKGVSGDGVFASIAEAIERIGDSRLRVYLYHIPPMAGVGFDLEVVGRLIDAYPETIAGLKDSSGDWENTKALIEAYPGLAVFSGSEVFLLANLRAGGAGCITATANINPAAIRDLYKRWADNNADSAQADVTALREIVQAHPMIPALKSVVAAYMGAPGWARVRPPLVALGAAGASALAAGLRALDFRRPARPRDRPRRVTTGFRFAIAPERRRSIALPPLSVRGCSSALRA